MAAEFPFNIGDGTYVPSPDDRSTRQEPIVSEPTMIAETYHGPDRWRAREYELPCGHTLSVASPPRTFVDPYDGNPAGFDYDDEGAERMLAGLVKRHECSDR